MFPRITLQTCIVHLLRQSPDFANGKQRKPFALALRAIYAAPSAELALSALDAFERGEWGQRFPTIVAASRVGACDSILCLPAGDSPRDLPDGCARERACTAPQNPRDPRPFSERRRRDETHLVGASQHHGDMAARRTHMALGDESICDSLWRSLYSPDDVKCTSAWTPPSRWTHRSARRNLENRTERGFPQRPHASPANELYTQKT